MDRVLRSGFSEMLETPQRTRPAMASQTDCGRVRDHNEDVVFVSDESGVALLADGMGGYNAGEVAARMAVDIVADGVAQAVADEGLDRLAEADPQVGLMRATVALSEHIQRANEAIFEAAINDPECEGMGTTLVALMVSGARLILAHVGDSRCYRLRGGALSQLTRDHSLLQEQIDSGQWRADKAHEFPRRNLVTRALGAEHFVQVDVAEHEVQAGDLYLLCSDGLTDMLSNAQITAIMKQKAADLSATVVKLIDAANQHGGRDNVSAVLVRIPEAYLMDVKQPAVLRKRQAA